VASNASMSRNCSAAVPGGPTELQLVPPSVVRRTVPVVPLTHAVWASMADRPRNRSLVPVGVRFQL
jgi:hypothetical protein